MLKIDTVIYGSTRARLGSTFHIPFSSITSLDWKEDDVLVSFKSKGMLLLPCETAYTVGVVHSDSYEDVRRYMHQSGNPLWDVLHELKFNPQFGSQLEAVKKHFNETCKNL